MELTRQCLQSLVDLEDLAINKDFEVVVVDNASSDGSPEMIAEEFPQVKLVASEENLGFSKGNNLGLSQANTESDYTLFLNSDTVVPSGTLSEMVNFMDKNKDVGISTCKVKLWSGGLDWDAHRGFPTPLVSLTRLLGLNKVFPKSRLFNSYNQGWKDMETTHKIDACVGAFFLIRRSIGNKLGWWDEDYFLNGEDLDLCYRAKQLGPKVMYHPAVEIIHYRGASKGTREESREVTTASKKGKQIVADASVNSMQLFYNKHLRKNYPWLINKLVDASLRVLLFKRRLAIG